MGFAAVEIAGTESVLSHLWVLPSEMGRGIGRALFAYAETVAHDAGATRLTITSDPHAGAFYRRMGAVVCGWQTAPMDGAPDRRLPLLTKELSGRV